MKQQNVSVAALRRIAGTSKCVVALVKSYSPEREEEWQWTISCLSSILKKAGKAGIRILIDFSVADQISKLSVKPVTTKRPRKRR